MPEPIAELPEGAQPSTETHSQAAKPSAWSDDPLMRLAQAEAECRRVQDPAVQARTQAELQTKPPAIQALWERLPGTHLYRVRPGHPQRHLRGTLGFIAAWFEDGTVDFRILFPPVGQPALPVGVTVAVEAGHIEMVPLATVQKRARELAEARKSGPQVGLLVTLSEGGAIAPFILKDGKLRIVGPAANPADILLAMDRLQAALVQRHRAPKEPSRIVAPGQALVEEVLRQNDGAVAADNRDR